MGLEIVAAAAGLPEVRNGRLQSPANVFAVSAALPVCRKALQRARCEASDVGLIISKGVSPSHVALSADIAGPRVGHPLQQALGAKHAFVFDLLDADWVAALDTAEAFMLELGMEVALLVHAETSAPNVEADAQSGFALNDGVGALVVRAFRDGSRSSFARFRTPARAAAIWKNPAQAAQVARFEFAATSELVRETQEVMGEALRQQLDAAAALDRPVLVAEEWFDCRLERASLPALPRPAVAAVRLGALTFPVVLESSSANGPWPTRDVVVVGFDPFRLRASCRVVRAGVQL